MTYAKMMPLQLAKRLRAYAGYVGCGCYHSDGKCRRQRTCARGDYTRVCLALLAMLTPQSRAPRRQANGRAGKGGA